MTQTQARCLILACGNTLREDDGVGPWLAQWAEERFAADPSVRVISRQQWTPELAEEIASAQSVLFIDCSIDSLPGSLRLHPVEPAPTCQGLGTHHLGAAELLALTRDLSASLPRAAHLMTIGAGSTGLGESFSDPVQVAIPEACRLIEETVSQLRNGSDGATP
jgi:hydrogenase maturation protease